MCVLHHHLLFSIMLFLMPFVSNLDAKKLETFRQVLKDHLSF